MNLNEWADEIYEINKANGWFDKERSFGDDIALIHSEVSEALEEYRRNDIEDTTLSKCLDKEEKQHPGHTRHWLAQNHFTRDTSNHICKPEGVGSELADIIVRVLDTAKRLDIDMNFEMQRKVNYNKTRGYRHGNKLL